MQLPFPVDHWHAFDLPTMDVWVAAHHPTQIEMTDRQYAWYANLCRTNKRDFKNIPIVFVEASNV